MMSIYRRLLHLFKSPAGQGTLEAKGIDFKGLAESSADVILLVGADMRATYVSPSCRPILGWDPEDLVGKHPKEIFLPEDLPIIEKAARQLYSEGISVVAPAARIRCKDGSIKWCESRAQLAKASGEGPRDVVVILRDVTDQMEHQNKLAALAMTDGLTLLANRRAFDEALLREWKSTQRSGNPTSLLLLDLDHFKAFNDLYGHQVGDDCLRSVSAAVVANVRRPRDFVARYGGEEIAVILPETDSPGALTVGEWVREAIEKLKIPHLGNPEGNGWVTVSIGLATAVSASGAKNETPEGLLLVADTALYKAKRNGRNRLEHGIIITPP